MQNQTICGQKIHEVKEIVPRTICYSINLQNSEYKLYYFFTAAEKDILLLLLLLYYYYYYYYYLLSLLLLLNWVDLLENVIL